MIPDLKCLLYQVLGSHYCQYCVTTCGAETICGIHRWAQLKSKGVQRCDWAPSTYHTAQQERCLWDYRSYDWQGFNRKSTMGGKHREYFRLQPAFTSLFYMEYHPPLKKMDNRQTEVTVNEWIWHMTERTRCHVDKPDLSQMGKSNGSLT